MAGRRCPTKGCPTIIPAGTRYCPTHQRDYEARRGNRQARGYGTSHDKLRAAWQQRINAGEHITCATCPTPITPDTPWQLGHDHERGGYLGPQCVPCNTSDGGRRAHL
jgi:hypothetical protein